jgi:hypothetical protein
MVAAAALASGFGGSTAPSSRGTMAAGIGLILASQMLAAGQLLIDQGWAYGRLRLSPLKVVGCEGLLGFVLTVGAWLGTLSAGCLHDHGGCMLLLWLERLRRSARLCAYGGCLLMLWLERPT